MNQPADESTLFWLRKARRLAVTVNAARWLEVMLPGAAVAALFTGFAVLIRRRQGLEALPPEVLAVAAVVLLGIALFAWRRMLARRCTLAEALTRLDARLSLNNRLTSAHDGVGEWPPVMPAAPHGFRWRWERVSAMLGGAVVFLGSALLIPVTPAQAVVKGKMAPPQAWEQVTASLETLKEEELVSAEALEALEKKLESLREQPEEQWYRQSNLEASDSLRMEAARALQMLTQNLEHAQGLTASHGERLDLNAIDSNEQVAQWNEALTQLGGGTFPLDEKQLQALKEQAAGMDKEAMKALGEKLSAQLASAKQAMESLGSLRDALQEFAQQSSPCPGGVCQGGDCPHGEQRDGPGTEGGGHDPLQIARNAPVRPPGGLEALPERGNDDYRFGQVITTTDGEHEVDRTAAHQREQGGAIVAPGSGGEAVWRDELLPSEKAFLQKFFK